MFYNWIHSTNKATVDLDFLIRSALRFIRGSYILSLYKCNLQVCHKKKLEKRNWKWYGSWSQRWTYAAEAEDPDWCIIPTKESFSAQCWMNTLPLAFLCRTEQCPDLVIFDENIKCHFVRGYVYSAKNVPISTMLKCQVLFVLWVLMFVEEMRRWVRSTLASLCKSSVGHTSAHYSNPWSAQWEMFIKYKCFGIQWNIWRKPMFG